MQGLLLVLALGGVIWGLWSNKKHQTLKTQALRDEAAGLEHLLQESALVRQDLEKLLTEVTDTSQVIIDDLTHAQKSFISENNKPHGKKPPARSMDKPVYVAPVQWKPFEKISTQPPGGKVNGYKPVLASSESRSNTVVPLYLSPPKPLGPPTSLYAQVYAKAEQGEPLLKIAEELGIGQGEVGLILNLYRKNAIH